MTQPRTHSHAEALANGNIGTLLGQGLLWLFGVAIIMAIWLNVVFFAASYARSYVIRRFFARLG
jgi:hypothetical protein